MHAILDLTNLVSFFRRDLYFHLVVCLLLALVFRVLLAFYSYGPQSLDDYRHGLFPALQLSHGEKINLPDYRNQPLVWLVAGVITASEKLGFTTALYKLNLVYLFLGLISLVGIVGVYFIARNYPRKSLALIFLYAMALSPSLAFVSTRILGESISASFLILALGFLYQYFNDAKNKWLVFCCLALGVATIFRFQVGLIYFALGAYFLSQRRFKEILTLLYVGCFLVALQSGFDYLAGRPFLGTLRAYFEINKNGAIEFGVSPWYTTWLTLLGFLFVPISLPTWLAWHRVWKNHKEILLVVLVFVLSHSMIPHKEERFLFPIFPLVSLLLISCWYYSRKTRGVRYFFLPVYAVFNIALFIFGVVSNSQESIVGPVATLQNSDSHKSIILDINPAFGSYGLREFFIPDKSKYFEIENFSESNIKNTFAQTNIADIKELIVLTSSDVYPMEIENNLIKSLIHCEKFERFQSLSDKLIYYLNRDANQRRRASWRTRCPLQATAFNPI